MYNWWHKSQMKLAKSYTSSIFKSQQITDLYDTEIFKVL